MIKKIKIFAVLVLILATSYICKKFYDYKYDYNSNNLNKLAVDLSIPVYNYISQFGNEDLTKHSDFQKMEEWIEKNYGVLSVYNHILKKGYGIEYLKEKNIFVFYLKQSNDEKFSITQLKYNYLIDDNTYGIKEFNFFDYLFNSPKNIILFGYLNTDNCYKDDLSYGNNLYNFYRGIELVDNGDPEKDKILSIIDSVESDVLAYLNLEGISQNQICFKLKNKTVSLLCENKLENTILTKILSKLQNSFENELISTIDYGIFCLGK